MKLDPDLQKIFDDTPTLTPEAMQELQKAGEDLKNDPEFVAECARGLMVEDVLRIIEEVFQKYDPQYRIN